MGERGSIFSFVSRRVGMHELALCQAIADTVSLVPDSLLFSWELLTAGTQLDGCELVIDHVPAVVDCRTCGQQSTLDLPILLCRSCESSDVALVSGEEFLITSIDRTREVC